MLFRSFVAFCLFTNVKLSDVSVPAALSYLEFLVENEVSVNMIKNHISAIRAMSMFLICIMGLGNILKLSTL